MQKGNPACKLLKFIKQNHPYIIQKNLQALLYKALVSLVLKGKIQ